MQQAGRPTGLQKHREREVALLGTFDRSLKILDEMLSRLETQMFPTGTALESNRYDPQHAKDVVSISRALSQTGAVHARLLESQALQADNMTPAEKLSYMVAAISKYPATEIKKVVTALQRQLDG